MLVRNFLRETKVIINETTKSMGKPKTRESRRQKTINTMADIKVKDVKLENGEVVKDFINRPTLGQEVAGAAFSGILKGLFSLFK